jgi:hypothetical protein
MKVADFLVPGDVLLYRPTGLFGRIIALKTWHKVGHCEVYVGDGVSVASRDGKGVGRYELRTKDLFKVCRPKDTHPFDLAAALRWFDMLPPTRYGWGDLLAFIGVERDHGGIVCSPFATEFLRAGGVDPFDGEPARWIAPFQFDLSPVLKDYVVKDGEVIGLEGVVRA